jgi:hypothetical protein
MLGDGGSPGDMPSASVLDRRTLPAWVWPVGEDARAAPTASSGACMTGPYQRRHPCSHHPLPRRWIDGTDGVRAGVRAGLDCVADTCLEGALPWDCIACGKRVLHFLRERYVYHRLGEQTDGWSDHPTTTIFPSCRDYQTVLYSIARSVYQSINHHHHHHHDSFIHPSINQSINQSINLPIRTAVFPPPSHHHHLLLLPVVSPAVRREVAARRVCSSVYHRPVHQALVNTALHPPTPRRASHTRPTRPTRPSPAKVALPGDR